MVLVGLPPQALPVPIFELVLKGISVTGSIVGTRKDLQDTLALAARGLVKCITPMRGWKISMTSLMKCAPARSTVASFWKLREQTPAVVMMVPGLYPLETLVYFDQHAILQGLSAGVLVGFVVGSIAFGLAAARFISQPEWLRE